MNITSMNITSEMLLNYAAPVYPSSDLKTNKELGIEFPKFFPKVTTWKQLLVDPRVVSVHWENNDGETSGGKRSLRDVWVELIPSWSWEGCQCIHEWSKGDAIEAFQRIENRPIR